MVFDLRALDNNTMKVSTTLFFSLLLFIVGCNNEETPNSPPDISVTPESFEINILSPSTDGALLLNTGLIRGECGKPGYPIEVVGPYTFYTVCQDNYTWHASLHSSGLSAGTVQFNVFLREKNLSGGSPGATRVFNRIITACDSEENHSKLFANSDSGGDGTSTPYMICTPEQFSNIRFHPDKKFVLGKNIDFGHLPVKPIQVTFSGELDGQGFHLENFDVNETPGDQISVALFGVIQNGKIRNLGLKNGTSKGTERVGLLAGDWRGTGLIENVKVMGSVEGISWTGGLIGISNTSSALNFVNVTANLTVKGNNFTGGLIGQILTNDGSLSMSNSSIYSTVEGLNQVGGLIGSTLEDNFTMNNVSHKGSVTSLGINVGGIAGEISGGSFILLSHEGLVSSEKDAVDVYLGGLFGHAKGSTSIDQSFVKSSLSSGGHFTGGLIGRMVGGEIKNSFSIGTISVQDNYYNSVTRFVGGLAGNIALNTSISSSYSQMSITAEAQYVGGLVGLFNGDLSAIERSYYKGEISARTSYVGGLAGSFNGRTFKESYSQAVINVTTPTPNAYLGGLIGYFANDNATIEKVYHSGPIIISNGIADNVGGLFGYLKAVSLTNAFFNGTITGVRSKIGGIAGDLTAKINSVHTSGRIEAGLRYIGGISGIARNSEILNSFSKMTLKGATEVGGLVGWYLNTDKFIHNSYFSGDLIKNSSSSFPDNLFGPISGILSVQLSQEPQIVSSSSSYKNELDNSDLIHNNLVSNIKTSTELQEQVTYNGYDFGPEDFNWTMPSPLFTLPFESSVYDHAVPRWLLASHLGLPVPENPGPIIAVVPPIIFQDSTLPGQHYTLEELSIISASSAPTEVIPGQLQLSLSNPATDYLPIAAKKLIYGECGIPGGIIQISGQFNLKTICQPNFRWVALINASALASGNITLTVRMGNLSGSQNTLPINRILIKTDSLCGSELARIGQYANSHLNPDGSESNPFLICHSGHFANIALNPDKYFKLADDVYFAGNNLRPISANFSGTIDGQNFKISSFHLSWPNETGVGLFKVLQDATIKNLKIDNAKVKGLDRVGIIAGSTRGNVLLQKISASGSVKGIISTGGLIGISNTASRLTLNDLSSNIQVEGNNYTGGIIGQITSSDGDLTVDQMKIKGSVKGLNFVGGLAGLNAEPNSNIQNTSVLQGTTLIALGTHVGGLVGHNQGGTFKNVSVNGSIDASKDAVSGYVGGIIGLDEGTLSISSSQFSGQIQTGMDYVGGIVGRAKQGTFNDLQSFGSIVVHDDKYNSIRSWVGGLIGFNELDSTLTNSTSLATINANAQFVGGLAGRFDGKLSVLTDSNFKGSITARTAYIGGVAGLFEGPVMTNCYSTAAINVSTPTPNANIGGLLGYANSLDSDFSRLYSTGHVLITNGIADYVGGLIGYFRGGSLRESYATGNVSGVRSSSGGLVGLHRGELLRSFSTGNVTGTFRHNGGLVGYLYNGSVENSFSLGDVTAATESGALIGNAHTTFPIKNSYAFGKVSKTLESPYGDETFGPIVAVVSNPEVLETDGLYYLMSKHHPSHNTLGSVIQDSDAHWATSYGTFDFQGENSWRIPSQDYQLPGRGNYAYPVLSWMDQNSTPTNPDHFIKGTVAGLQFGTIQLRLNNSETITLNPGETNFTFTTKILSGSPYHVTILTHPTFPTISCSLLNGSGTMGNTDVENISVICPTIESIAITNPETSLNVGSSLQISVIGEMSNDTSIDLTSVSNYSFDNPASFNLSSSGLLTALSSGSTIVSVQFLEKSANKSFSSIYIPPNAKNLYWTPNNPSPTLALTARWTPSESPTLVSQTIRIYEMSSCSGAAVRTAVLVPGMNSYLYTGMDNKNYSFRISSLQSDNSSIDSSCSPPILITVPVPNPPSIPIFASTWVRGSSPVTSPLLSWSNATGIKSVKVALGTTIGGTNKVNWTDRGLVASHTFTGLSSMTTCGTYYASIRSVGEASKESSIVSESIGFKYDNTVPTLTNAVSLKNNVTTDILETPSISWVAGTDTCAFKEYEVAIGTTSGGTQIQTWTPIGNITNYTAQSGEDGFNFTLSPSTNYYFSVRAVDQAGNRSSVRSSPAFTYVNSMNRALWYDGQSLEHVMDQNSVYADAPTFSGQVYRWKNKTSTTLNFNAVNAAGRPLYSPNMQELLFNGTNKLMYAGSSSLIDSGTFKTKNVIVSFRTGANVNDRQVIYEQGNGSRGMNLYIDSGKLYCGFWNVTNGGDGVQELISMHSDILANSIYHTALLLDYSNYVSATGPDGIFKCQIGTTTIGSGNTTSRLYSQTGSTGLGGTYKGTRFHDNSVTTVNGQYFHGAILELQMLQVHPTEQVLTAIMEELNDKWLIPELSAPGNFAIINNSNASKSATATWTAITNPNFPTSSYMMALGTYPGGSDIVAWKDIGNVLSYQFINGTDGVLLGLDTGVNYYLSLKALDSWGLESLIVTSIPWQYVPPTGTLAGTFLKIDAKELGSISDETGTFSEEENFNGKVSLWRDLITDDGEQNFSALTASSPVLNPTLLNGVQFSSSKYMTVANHPDINTSISTKKSVTVAFTTGSNVTTRQVIFDLGSRNRGMNIYILGGNLYCGFWVTSNGGDGAQSFLGMSTGIIASSSYVVSLVYDYRNYTGASGPNGNIKCYVNQLKIGEAMTTSRLYSDTSRTGIGAQVDGSRYHDTNSSSSALHYFLGRILEVTMTKSVPEETEIQQYQQDIRTKWGF